MARGWVICLTAHACCSAARAAVTSMYPEDLVTVTVGTGTRDGGAVSNGNTLPQVKRPWGFNDWAPSTNSAGGSWWFRDIDTRFQGMRCTHQPSPWIGDYGHFVMQPAIDTGSGKIEYSYRARAFRPYLFNATLSKSGDDIGFEFAPTNRAAILRITYPSNAETRRLLVSYGNGDATVDRGAIRGSTTDSAGGVPNHWRMFFIIKPGPTGTVSIGNGRAKNGIVEFPAGEPGIVSVATSFISHAQAELNLLREVGDRTFDEIVKEGKMEWNTAMSQVDVSAVDENQLRVFYTNLWKGMLFPRYLQEIDAKGHEVHLSPYTGEVRPGKLVTDSGFWDAYRTVYTLQSLAFPENFGTLVDGWVNAYSEASWLPTWASPGQRGSMVGTMGDVTLADAIVKSKWGFVSGFDADRAYEAIRKDAYEPPRGGFGRDGLPEYVNWGYVPEASCRSHRGRGQEESVSRTMNYWVADAAIARAAAALGRKEDEAALSRRSLRYEVLFNNKSSFFQPKDDQGRFCEPFDPLAWKDGFTEASAWQYRFYVPHDVEGLKALYQGKLCERIEEMLTSTTGTAYKPGGYGSAIHEMREMGVTQPEFGLYGHNNQPSHHILWVAKKAGCDELADKYLRKVMDKLYTLRGWSGDEDNGEMASWYVLSALGLYSLEIAKDEFVVGSPAIVHATVKLPNERQLTIMTDNQGPDNVYVHAVTWMPTGEDTPHPVEGNALKYTEVMRGGILRFTLGSEPKGHTHYI